MFNVFVADGNQEVPDDDVFYVVAGNGIFIRKKLGILDALVPATKIPHLNHVVSYATLDLPRIPKNDFAEIVSFFREVYEEHKAEAVALLHFNEDKKHYKIQIPFQEVTGGSVDYERTLPWQEQGYILMCTIHSHAGFGAFHSTTDHTDEKHFDGLHITVGDLSKDLHTISTSVVVNGKRFITDTHEYVEGVEDIEYTNYTQHMFRPTFKMVKGVKVYEKEVKKQKGFHVESVPFERTWMDFVERKSPTVYYVGLPHAQRGRVQSPVDPSEMPHGSWLPHWYRRHGIVINPDEYDPFDGLEPDEGGGGFYTGQEVFHQQELPLIPEDKEESGDD
jgi:hypothetical protein